MTSFNELGLAESLLKALSKEGYETPTPIQTQSIPKLLEGRDLLGIAQTGTGKTAAFALPILQRLAPGEIARPRRVRALILSPTRELATQIAESFRAYGHFMNHMSVATIFGGVSHRPQEERLRRGVDILVATPGRLIDHLDTKALSLETTEVFVLDEADQMLDMGFVHAVRRIMKTLPSARQTLLFSATMPKEIGQLAGDLLTDPVTVKVTPVATTAERVEQRVIHVDTAAKRTLLRDVLVEEKPERCLVFTRTKHGADRVVRSLAMDGIAAVAIHGNKSQAQRERALAGFKDGKTPILIATDIAARGIDVSGVSHVVNFDLPNIPESYVHRIGRTARAGASGVAISFCDHEERAYLKDIEKLTRQQIPSEDRRGKIELRHMPRQDQVEVDEDGEEIRDERPARGARGGRPGGRSGGGRGHGQPGGRAGGPAGGERRGGGNAGGGERRSAGHGGHGPAKADGAKPRGERRPAGGGTPAHGSGKPNHRDNGAAEASLGRVGFLASPGRPAAGESRGPRRGGRG
ncbi:DEAD/DEAH box helicase [Oharaeibacter diazotrophicus]|uniref:DEAD-box ATP-dependent RNA helicase RhpA n=2 Tax=Oharaeibacter diazotrophicus TaxID=1920512 RepID=A0A4R6RA48_9HYPH|nr:DEAD/DEAH box helicase [Oharaeibacter diazotrophicus]TDP82765.1 ATP-dependent RNA helicase RhlE [Oharaeibacter diazotrophicus]BBE72473.1 ATP-dependent RNA helicase RhlE [Pleomorphomonas sp. SM30]GLS76504.1 hypothetical protein GCM10007904_18410 [Oharaeibacter diazotrophicus]